MIASDAIAEDVAEPHRAGFVSRVSADVVDAVLVSVGTALILVTGSMLRALFAGSVFAFPRPNALGTAGALSVVFVLYLTFFWSATGRTPGKQVAGLRVVSERGEPLSALRAFARALVCVVFPAGLLWVVVSRRNRAVHDIVLGTAVIYDWRPARRSTTALRGSSAS
jgi:uncharacterized RDD family membrane protein YckC